MTYQPYDIARFILLYEAREFVTDESRDNISPNDLFLIRFRVFVSGFT